jgi:hypothetical protein
MLLICQLIVIVRPAWQVVVALSLAQQERNRIFLDQCTQQCVT